jgi:predicted dehydrogenase
MAIIGVGWAGTKHVDAIRELGRKAVVHCIVDNDVDFLKSKASELNIHKTYTDFHDALTDSDIDAVSICLPHKLHCPVALDAADANKHILCEKPIALTVEEATLMIEAAEVHSVKLYIAENAPYSAMSKFLKEIVETGKYIGEVTFVSFVNGFQALEYGYTGRRAWLSMPEQGGTGTWMLHGIHSIAQLRFIFGEVETVYMQEHHIKGFKRPDLEGTMSGLLTMESGIHVSIEQTCETHLGKNLKGCVIYGEKGTIRALPERCEVFQGKNEPLIITYPEYEPSMYAQEIEAFADYVAGVSDGPTNAKSELRSLAVVQAGYESVSSGEPINLKKRFYEW